MNVFESINRHNFSENLMRERINLTYTDALKVFNECILINDDLAVAYSNYKNLKSLSMREIDDKSYSGNILIHTALDKFIGSLFFTIINKEHHALHIEYNNNTKTFKTLEIGVDPLYPDNPYYGKISFVQNIDSNDLKSTWRDLKLILTLINNNPLVPRHKRNIMVNQAYPSDKEYGTMSKEFRPITDDSNEINFFEYSDFFVSTYNPSHTTLLPEDIENYYNRASPVKNARPYISNIIS